MATDQSPPRNRLIFIMAIGTVVTLVGLKFVFDSYFLDMYETEAKAKIASPEELWKLREDENKRLSQSPTPIDQAMQQIGRGREGSALIAPQQSTDDAPLTGWSKLAKTATNTDVKPSTNDGTQPAQPPTLLDAGIAPNAAGGDAGKLVTTDAGVINPAPIRRPSTGMGQPPGTTQPNANSGNPPPSRP